MCCSRFPKSTVRVRAGALLFFPNLLFGRPLNLMYFFALDSRVFRTFSIPVSFRIVFFFPSFVQSSSFLHSIPFVTPSSYPRHRKRNEKFNRVVHLAIVRIGEKELYSSRYTVPPSLCSFRDAILPRQNENGHEHDSTQMG